MTCTTPRALTKGVGRRADRPPHGGFSAAEVTGLPDTVRRYFEASIVPGTPMASWVRFRMRGSVRIGGVWLPFRARQTLSPLRGFTWAARVAGVLVGSDQYADGAGAMEWSLLGLIRVIHADGEQLSRSSAGRAGAEAVWVPTSMLPRFGVRWTGTGPHHAVASYSLDRNELELHYTFDEAARVRSVVLDRWGDPEGNGTWGFHRFEHRLTRHSSFGGVSIPCAGRGAWLATADRWGEGEFFRYEITDYQLISDPGTEAP